MYEIFEQLMKKHGVKASTICKETGISSSTITDWKKGRYTPKQDKLQKIADYFGVSLEYLMNGETEDAEPYYINDDARELAQFLFENPDYKVLFDASRTIKKEDIQFVKDMIDKLNGR